MQRTFNVLRGDRDHGEFKTHSVREDEIVSWKFSF